MDAAKYIKESVDIRQAAEFYGVLFNGRGQAACPFHDDKHPSATVKNGRFHCFVCDLHLDVIDLVCHISGCNFRGALERINDDFRLGLDLKKPIATDEMRRIQEERRRKERELEAYRAEYNARQEEFIRIRETKRPPEGHPSMGEYARLLGRKEYLEWWHENHHWR